MHTFRFQSREILFATCFKNFSLKEKKNFFIILHFRRMKLKFLRELTSTRCSGLRIDSFPWMEFTFNRIGEVAADTR